MRKSVCVRLNFNVVSYDVNSFARCRYRLNARSCVEYDPYMHLEFGGALVYKTKRFAGIIIGYEYDKAV